ncbi:MAG: hypothetical protein KY395_04785 [Actinobacteria bacterium]|nr:hypothetical protein [Actinomycetota bacterium]
MQEATTTRQTRVLIGEAMHRGRIARGAVDLFAVVAATALDAFDTDAARYELDDDAYHQFEKDFGVYALLRLASAMEGRLDRLWEQRR